MAEKKKGKGRRKKQQTITTTSMPQSSMGQTSMLKTLDKVRWEAESEIRASDDNVLTFTQMAGSLIVLILLIFNPEFREFLIDLPEFSLPLIFFFLFFVKRMSVIIRDYMNPDLEQRQFTLSMKKARKIDEYYENLPEDELVKAFRKIGMGTNKWWEIEEGNTQTITVQMNGGEEDEAEEDD